MFYWAAIFDHVVYAPHAFSDFRMSLLPLLCAQSCSTSFAHEYSLLQAAVDVDKLQ